MRSRTVREGSVGLLILLGLGLFGGLVLWIRGLSFGNRSYKAIIEFANVAGMQLGASVRYRGVPVGKITAIQAGSNGVDVTVEITPADLQIPRDVVIEANQSGLISETLIDMTPKTILTADTKLAKPSDPDCATSNVIICSGSRLQGQIGVSYDELIRSTVRVANIYSQPEFYANINSLTKNASTAAAGVSQLTRDLSSVSAGVKEELRTLSAAATSVSQSANRTTAQVGVAASQLGNTANQFGLTANQINRTANQYSLTAEQLNQLLGNVNGIVTANRGSLVATLNNLSQTSEQLRLTVTSLTPTVNKVGQGELLRNLETLSVNAAQASANLRDLSGAFNTPANVLMLQQTLDSARATFQNANKITADLDDLTGDPTFRTNLKNLVNNLSGLVASTEQLEQQIQVAETLEPVSTELTQGTGEKPKVSGQPQEEFKGRLKVEGSNQPSNLQSSHRQPPLVGAGLKPVFNPSAEIQLQQLLDQFALSSTDSMATAEKPLKPLQPSAKRTLGEVKGLLWNEESTERPAEEDF